MSVIRSAGLRGFRQVVADLGGDADRYAREAGLDVAALDADDLLVPDFAVAATLEIAAGALDCPDLGLRVAAHQDLSMLGPLALAIQNSPTVATALECTSRYLFVHAPAMRIGLEPDPDGVRGVQALRYDVTSAGVAPPVQGTDLSLGSLHRAIVSLVGGRYGLRSVDLPHRPVAPREAYEDFFGAPARFDRPAAMLRLPSSLGDLPISGRDETVRRLAMTYLAEQAPAQRAPMTARVRGVVTQLIGTGPAEIGDVAALFNLHPRTLQRRLAAEGSSYVRLRDDARRQQARHYLEATTLPFAQVAGLIGLSEQSALTRSCRRWFGRTPRQVRRGVPRG